MTLDRFWSKAQDTGSCWEWTAALSHGYGMFWISKRVAVRAHRFAYEAMVGPIPEGLVLDHLCRNRACVNPSHLDPVTQAENNRRSASPSGLNTGKTHCKHGHEFTPENTYFYAKGRACRACLVIRKRRYRRERNAAHAI